MALPGLTLISATPSPFARMNRIALLEKEIPFTLRSEIPWHPDTETPQHNPLEKLPILLFDDGRAPVYDSAHIQEYIVAKFATHGPRLLTGDLDVDLDVRQVVVLAEGVLDALVLALFESMRQKEAQNEKWAGRQVRKMKGGMRAFGDLAKKKPAGDEFLFQNTFTIADIALCCAVTHVDHRKMQPDWQQEYPELKLYWEKMESRPAFRSTMPVPFDLKKDEVL